jgi:hypothetical protein
MNSYPLELAPPIVELRQYLLRRGRRDGGPVWGKHGPAANATMINSEDVHQLRVIGTPEAQVRIRRAGDRDADGNRGSILIVVSHRRSEDDDELIRGLLIPTVEQVGVRTLGLYATDLAENSFPPLPVRSSNVLVWIAGSDTVDTLDDTAEQVSIARRRIADHATANGHDEILLDVLRLEPTDRSCLNGGNVQSQVGPYPCRS